MVRICRDRERTIDADPHAHANAHEAGRSDADAHDPAARASDGRDPDARRGGKAECYTRQGADEIHLYCKLGSDIRCRAIPSSERGRIDAHDIIDEASVFAYHSE